MRPSGDLITQRDLPAADEPRFLDRVETGFPALKVVTLHGHAINCVLRSPFWIGRTPETGLHPGCIGEFFALVLPGAHTHVGRKNRALGRFGRSFGWFVLFETLSFIRNPEAF